MPYKYIEDKIQSAKEYNKKHYKTYTVRIRREYAVEFERAIKNKYGADKTINGYFYDCVRALVLAQKKNYKKPVAVQRVIIISDKD